MADLPRLQQRLDKALATARTPEEKLRTMAREMVAYFWQETLFVAIVTKNPGHERTSEPLLEKERSAFRNRLAKVLAEGRAERLGRFFGRVQKSNTLLSRGQGL